MKCSNRKVHSSMSIASRANRPKVPDRVPALPGSEVQIRKRADNALFVRWSFVLPCRRVLVEIAVKGWWSPCRSCVGPWSPLVIPEGCNLVLGQSHFIKTVEDLFEALVTSSPSLEFGIAFCEASGDCLVRRDGNAPDLVEAAVANAARIDAGHVFVVLLRNGYPINVLGPDQGGPGGCAGSSPPPPIPFRSWWPRRTRAGGVAGVVDGFPTRGVETDEDASARRRLLRDLIGYKR